MTTGEKRPGLREWVRLTVIGVVVVVVVLVVVVYGVVPAMNKTEQVIDNSRPIDDNIIYTICDIYTSEDGTVEIHDGIGNVWSGTLFGPGAMAQ